MPDDRMMRRTAAAITPARISPVHDGRPLDDSAAAARHHRRLTHAAARTGAIARAMSHANAGAAETAHMSKAHSAERRGGARYGKARERQSQAAEHQS